MSKTKKKGKKIKWIVIALVLLLGVGGFILSRAAKPQTTPIGTYTSGTVKKEDLSKYVNMSGTVTGKDSVNITGDPSLKVIELNVKKGDEVKKGDILCKFDTTSLQEEFDALSESNSKSQGAANYSHSINQRNLEQAKRDRTAAIAQAQQDLNDAIAKRDQAYADYDSRVQFFNTLNKDIERYFTEMSEAEDEAKAEEARAKWESARAQSDALDLALAEEHAQLASYDDAVTTARRNYDNTVRSTENAVQSAQDAVDQEQFSNSDDTSSEKLKTLSKQIEDCVVVAPIDGVITELNISEGTQPYSSNLMTISNASSLIVKGKVDESDILNIIGGMNAEIYTTATENETIMGKVDRIEHTSDNSGESSGGYNVEITFKDKRLLIGMKANVKIVLDHKDDVVCLPYDAVQKDENDNCYVWAAESVGDNSYKLKKVDIKTGFEGDYYTEITSGDLNVGDVIITGSYNVSEGDIVALEASEEE